ncbi:dihydroorotate dehydrogenase-like protein [Nocardioides sp. YIM 152588]|uniref:dihydroorotate dehydrogenase-like protein n=1 Tax=Nocardioides sp. YIM 152588 TaxID=3158259 RepID=UPI0032E3D93F
MDLSTDYLGLRLRSPIVASASPVSATLDGIRRVVDAGAGAVVLYSLFEEQVRAQEVEDLLLTEAHEGAFGEALDYFPNAPSVGPAGTTPYLRHLERAAAAVDVPVIASLNGSTPGGWTSIASSMESAGAAALELNVYAVPGDEGVTGADVERRHLEILAGVREAVSIPLAVKLSPFFSATGDVAAALDAAGADGLVLFNRFLQPDVDTEAIRVVPGVTFSSPVEARLPRTWIAILRHRVHGSLAATTGVDAAEDVVAYLLAGADVVMTASALLRHGPEHVGVLASGLAAWLERKGFASVDGARGLLAVPEGAHAGAEARAGYVRALEEARGHYGSLA